MANKQEFVEKLSFCRFNFGNSEIGQKLDGKAEIEENIDGNSEMLSPPAPPSESEINSLKFRLFNMSLGKIFLSYRQLPKLDKKVFLSKKKAK